LIDSIVLSISQMRKARHQRKVMVIISDVGDNRTRYSEKDVKSLIKEADVLVYSIGAFDREFQTLEERLGPSPIKIIPFTTKWSWSPTADAFVWETRN
jgi:Ca-activated chloride channel family protein